MSQDHNGDVHAVTIAITHMLDEGTEGWRGTLLDFLQQANVHVPMGICLSEEWPKSPEALSERLADLADELAYFGAGVAITGEWLEIGAVPPKR